MKNMITDIRQEPDVVNKHTCVVSGRGIQETGQLPSSAYHDHLFVFCCEQCKVIFDRFLVKFVPNRYPGL